VKELLVHVRRATVIESSHRVHFVVCRAEDARGLVGSGGALAPPSVRSGAPSGPPAAVSIVATAGNIALATFVRSAIKMFQALPLVEDGGVEYFGLTSEELALSAASHSGEPFHVTAARSILRKAGADEHALACGPHLPMHAKSAEALVTSGQPPSRVHNNCSGKHAGMIALAKLHGWATEGYHELAHPVQQRILETLAYWCDFPAGQFAFATDGCGLPTFALPLANVAAACARFSAVAADPSSPAGRVFSAMAAHPEYVAGTDRLCTDLIRAARGRLFAKVGAEGYYCAGVPAEGIGIALKVEDGAKRASEPALLAVLRQLDAIGEDELRSLARYARPTLFNTRGAAIGDIVAAWS